jgi:hypothetical protein
MTHKILAEVSTQIREIKGNIVIEHVKAINNRSAKKKIRKIDGFEWVCNVLRVPYRKFVFIDG